MSVEELQIVLSGGLKFFTVKLGPTNLPVFGFRPNGLEGECPDRLLTEWIQWAVKLLGSPTVQRHRPELFLPVKLIDNPRAFPEKVREMRAAVEALRNGLEPRPVAERSVIQAGKGIQLGDMCFEQQRRERRGAIKIDQWRFSDTQSHQKTRMGLDMAVDFARRILRDEIVKDTAPHFYFPWLFCFKQTYWIGTEGDRAMQDRYEVNLVPAVKVIDAPPAIESSVIQKPADAVLLLPKRKEDPRGDLLGALDLVLKSVSKLHSKDPDHVMFSKEDDTSDTFIESAAPMLYRVAQRMRKDGVHPTDLKAGISPETLGQIRDRLRIEMQKQVEDALTQRMTELGEARLELETAKAELEALQSGALVVIQEAKLATLSLDAELQKKRDAFDAALNSEKAEWAEEFGARDTALGIKDKELAAREREIEKREKQANDILGGNFRQHLANTDFGAFKKKA